MSAVEQSGTVDYLKGYYDEDVLMNRTNIALLEAGGYKYIIGARIKNENEELRKWIMSLEKKDGSFYEKTKPEGCRLIVGYSASRAKKDAYNRGKGIRRLRKAYGNGRITKDNINRRGYNKFLELTDDVRVSINQEKIIMDGKWDGLKGYLTNTNLSMQDVYEQYHELWVIERTYRVTKGTLEMRPMFHFTPRRIEAHVCICFVAYKVYQELERILKLSGINLSVDKVLSIAKTITTLKVRLPIKNQTLSKTMILTT
ncbi:MAG: transposase, partial [Candidatus Symbiothrix sp.]|nr:transposase [Candidatus Symbiothrix sp.]